MEYKYTDADASVFTLCDFNAHIFLEVGINGRTNCKIMTIMMQQAGALSVPVIASLTALILIFFFTLPSVYSISRRVYLGRQHEKVESASTFYEDEDGVATEEARKAYSATIPKYMALASTLSGLVVNITTIVFSEVQPDPPSHLEYWFTFGSWVG